MTSVYTEAGWDHIVTIQDQLPNGLTWTPANSGRWNCALSTTTQVNCRYTELGAFRFDPLNIDVRIPSDISDITLDNTATMNVEPADMNPNNNQTTITTNVDSVDLGLAKTFATIETTNPYAIRYTLVLTNAGPSDARNVVVQETLPAGLTFPQRRLYQSVLGGL